MIKFTYTRPLLSLKLYIGILGYIVLIPFQAFSQEPSFVIKNFTKGDHQGEYQNWSVTEGPEGFIYLANNSGLLEYDGINWEFHISPDINNIRSVVSDPSTGRIYTSGYREMGYWKRDSVGILSYTSLTPLAESEFVRNEEFWKIIIYSGKVIFQSFSGIFIFENDMFNVLRPEGFINTINLVGDSIYLHLQNKGISLLDQDKVVPALQDTMLDDKLIRFSFSIGKDSLLIGTASHGLFLIHEGRVRPVYEHLRKYFENNTINRGCLGSDSTIIIGTILDGITAIDRKGKLRFRINQENGLQNNTVLDLYSNNDKLWVALDRGVSFIDLNPDPSCTIYPVKETGAVYSAAVYNGKLYLGTNQGLYSRLLEENNDNLRLLPGTQGQVWDCQIIDSILFVGHNSGTFLVDKEGIQKISDVNGGFCIIENPFQPNTLIQSTYNDLVFFMKEKGEWSMAHTIGNFYDLIRFIEMDHHGNLWAGHMRRGVFKLKMNEEQNKVTDIHYFGKNSVFEQEYGIHVFKLENRVVFTTGKKLFTYDDLNDTIIEYSRVNESIGKYTGAHRIVKAPGHRYWFLTKRAAGLFHFDNDSIRLVKEFPMELINYHVIDDYENIIPLDTAIGLLCLENGFAILNADLPDSRAEIRDARLILKSISIHGNAETRERLPINKLDFIIPFSKNTLDIQFAFPYFSTRNIGFTYRVEGLDESWSEPKARPEFQLNRFPSGEYTIHVKAMNEWGESCPEFTLHLTVLQPWYFSVYALVFYFFTALGIVLLVRYVSVKKIKQREKHKRELKEQELTRLRNQNLQTELSYKSRELANSTMSIIQKNQFLLDLKELLKEHKSQLGTRYPERYYNHIVEKIDRNISGGDDWKIFEMNVEQAHESFIHKLINTYPELSHSDLRLCTYLRMNLTSKEIAPLMRISVRGVENHRYKIRKKLALSPEENLTDFILGFEGE
ncbi:MAG: regulator [Bacteroidales bacterium]|nr:regulator [Bacteroidales bacterium]